MFSLRSALLHSVVVGALASGFIAFRAYEAFAAEKPTSARPAALARTDIPAWPYPEGIPDDRKEDGTLFRVPGSKQAFTFTQINKQRATIDWFPERHPAPPPPVISGREGAYNACGQCHLIDGGGKPDTSDLRGLPVAYMLQQLADMRDDNRHASIANAPLAKMVEIAKALPLDDARQASEYFHSIKPIKRLRIVEGETVPVTHPAPHAVQRVDPSGAMEVIGSRILEVPQNFERTLLRDPSSGFIAYVPAGSVEKGKALATNGGNGRTLPCASCHGEDLRGSGDEFPGIAGRSPTAMARQLYDFKSGMRNGKNAVAMKPVVARLTDVDIVDLAAYLASLDP
jgi:cytochrome c553